MSPGMRRMTARQVEAILVRHGFSMISQRGSHRKWRHAQKRLQVIVPFHQGRQLPLGTLRNIMLNAEILKAEWRG